MRPERMSFGIFMAPFHRVGENPTLAIRRDISGLCSGLLLSPSSRLLRGNEVFLGELTAALCQRLERRKASAHARVREPFRMKLLIDVSLEAETPDAFDIAWCRTKPDSVENVDDCLVVRVRRDAAFLAGTGGPDGCGCDKQCSGDERNGRGVGRFHDDLGTLDSIPPVDVKRAGDP